MFVKNYLQKTGDEKGWGQFYFTIYKKRRSCVFLFLSKQPDSIKKVKGDYVSVALFGCSVVFDSVIYFIKLETIAQRMNYADKNITNLTRTVEESIFKPLLDFGLISSYAKESGLGGIKYVIKREKLSWKKELSKDFN